MHRIIVARSALAFAAALAGSPAFAVQVCELNGEHVNPANGSTTQGRSGLMRCREGEGGPVVREQELQKGVFMGVVRHFKDGVLEREHHVNERGNRDGRAREFALPDAAAAAGRGSAPVLVREATYRDGRTIGLARSWYPGGQLRRVSFHGDDDREQAVAEFNAQGQLSELRCGPRPLLGPEADDAHWCGHAGGPATVVLHGGKGQPRARVAHERGERRKSETLWDNGSVRESQDVTPTGGLERSFAADGVKRREIQWVVVERSGSERGRRVNTLDQEHHESGQRVRERRWRPTERGAELVSEQRWYLNGQPRELIEFVSGEGRLLRRETSFHDNGRKAREGLWVVGAGGGRGAELATGIHRSWDADARLRSERSYDERGRIARERELDASGKVVRDDEVFEDGSRKAFGR